MSWNATKLPQNVIVISTEAFFISSLQKPRLFQHGLISLQIIIGFGGIFY